MQIIINGSSRTETEMYSYLAQRAIAEGKYNRTCNIVAALKALFIDPRNKRLHMRVAVLQGSETMMVDFHPSLLNAEARDSAVPDSKGKHSGAEMSP
jgi:hypothetical protein